MMALVVAALLGAEPNPRLVVAARDLAAGEVLRAEDLAAADVPSALAIASFVRADSKMQIVGERLAAPLLKGDLVRWSFLAATRLTNAVDRCAAATKLAADARRQVGRHRAAVLAPR